MHFPPKYKGYIQSQNLQKGRTMGTFSLIGNNLHGSGESIGAAHSAQEATRAANQAKSASRQLKVIEANLAKTLMICEALWEILRDEHGYTTQDLHKKLYEIDMRDGVLDGKNQRKPTNCPNCNRTVSPRHPACIYCGQEIDNSVFSIS